MLTTTVTAYTLPNADPASHLCPAGGSNAMGTEEQRRPEDERGIELGGCVVGRRRGEFARGVSRGIAGVRRAARGERE